MADSATAAPYVVAGPALDFLMELLDTPAPSGFEAPAGDVWAAYAAKHAEVNVDPLGNRIARVNPGAGRMVMLAGHLDEIGFIVTAVNEFGQLNFAAIGGWDATVAVGQRVRVLTADGMRPGTVGQLPMHQQTDRTVRPRLLDLWIDIGGVNREHTETLVRPGDPIVIDATPHLFDNRRVMSRSADDRVGAFIAIEVARRCASHDVEVVAVGTTSEETTGIGAATAGWLVQPDEAWAIDVTYSSDVPGDHQDDAILGGGPAISIGGSTRSAPGRRLLEVAGRHDIAVQLIGEGAATHTDADEITRAGGGVPCGLVCIPTRYLHSPGELFDLGDVEAAVELLSRAIIETSAAS